MSLRSVGNTSKQPYFHLSACRRSSRAGIQSAIQGKWVFTRRIEDCAKPQAPGVSQAALEADHFAATLLMPRVLFTNAMRTAGDGLPAIEKLAKQCRRSLTATGIRYTKCTGDPVAIVLSTGARISYCFMSEALKEVEGLNWIRKGEGLSKATATFAFNQDPERVRRAEREQDVSDLQDWLGGDRSLSVTEQVIGLGSYGKTLTVLTALDLDEQIEEIGEEEEFVESWTPRFRRH